MSRGGGKREWHRSRSTLAGPSPFDRRVQRLAGGFVYVQLYPREPQASREPQPCLPQCPCVLLSLLHHTEHTQGAAYGLSRASPQQFLPHHLARLSAAIVTHDAQSVRQAARAGSTGGSHARATRRVRHCTRGSTPASVLCEVE